MSNHYPHMIPELCPESDGAKKEFYKKGIERIIAYVLPPNFFNHESAQLNFHRKLPIVCWSPLSDPPFELSFFLCCQFRANAFHFFSEMITRWLVPGKRLNALAQFAVDFMIPKFGTQKYIVAEVAVGIKTPAEFEILKQNLPILEKEIYLGVQSSYQASRILEIKGVSLDQKTTFIQENIVSLIRHRPQDFDYDILSEMQRFLVICKEEFKAARSYKHMSRIICVHYLFRKALKLSLEIYPDRRYISIKIIRALLNQKKPILGIALGISFIKDNEFFEAKHILNGVKALISNAKLVQGSFFTNKSLSDSTIALYIELEKESGQKFTLAEEKLIKQQLPAELKSRIEQRQSPIFMPQNEEEIMRHILTLSNQLQYVRDLPQVIIDFNQQTEESLEFSVIHLRIVKQPVRPILQRFHAKSSSVEFIPDRVKIVGSFRKKYQKEATVFRLRIQKSSFLRKDNSVDLYKARQAVVRELSKLIGEFRDFNGGIISKETELFESLRLRVDKKHLFLLENFFYSLTPAVMRSVLPSDVIYKLFQMLMEAELERPREMYQIGIQQEKKNFYILVQAKNRSFNEKLFPLLEQFEEQIPSFFLSNLDYPCFGVIGNNENGKKLQFLFEKTMAEWSTQFLVSQEIV